MDTIKYLEMSQDSTKRQGDVKMGKYEDILTLTKEVLKLIFTVVVLFYAGFL